MKFLEDKIKPRFGEEIVYQKIPPFRVHLPGNVSVGEFHKDKHYRDGDWADKVQELNYFVPLTKAYGTNTVWAETEEDLGDYKEIRGEYGECVEWEASKLTHGNKQNITLLSENRIYSITLPDIELNDTTGIGDIFASAFCCTMLKEKDVLWALSCAGGAAQAALESRQIG